MFKQQIRSDWTITEIENLFSQPFFQVFYRAVDTHRFFFPSNSVQISSLLSIKTGNCPEDCAYCAQSAHAQSKIKKHDLIDVSTVIKTAKKLKRLGITRLCMGAAWRNPPKNQFARVLTMIKAVKKMGLETCVTLGMLDDTQVLELKEAGLDYYNHNLDTSREYYAKIITTRTYQDRLYTLKKLRKAGIKICCGGIVGMGESRADRISLLQQLATFPQHPQSVPINNFVPIIGTRLDPLPIDSFEFVRVIAITRILMPQTMIRLAGGRESMSAELQALCFLAGANAIFCGEKLLTAKNVAWEKDLHLLRQLGLNIWNGNEHNRQIGQ